MLNKKTEMRAAKMAMRYVEVVAVAASLPVPTRARLLSGSHSGGNSSLESAQSCSLLQTLLRLMHFLVTAH
jgi:hypothetical protein